MEVVRVDFSKGLNAVTDRRLMPEGFSAICDNVDLRSGSARAFRMPETYQTGLSNVGRIFSFKGIWFYSANYRKYAAESIGVQNRIYFSDSGPNGVYLPPQKNVNGTQANLGTIVPRSNPVVKKGVGIVPTNVTLTGAITGGALQAGTYSYRISAVINGQTQQASQDVSITLSNPTPGAGVAGVITISWNTVANASSYIVFGRVAGKEQTLATLPTTSWVDNGGSTPAGNYASNYDQQFPYSYVYTYVRNVGGMQDEGGPSPISPTLTTGSARQININQSFDGYMDNAFTGIPATSASSSVVGTLCSAFKKGNRTILTLGTTPPSTWIQGMGVVLTPSGVFSNSITYPTAGSIPNSIPFTFPTALANPSVAPTAVVNTLATGSSSFTGVAYKWGIIAMRGGIALNNAQIVAGGVTLASPFTGSQSPTSSQTVGLNWTPIVDADYYIVIRQTVSSGLYYLAGVTPNPAFLDTGGFYNSYSTAVTLPAANLSSTNIITLVNTILPNSWYNSGGIYVFLSSTVVTASLPTPVYAINTTSAGSQNFNNGVDMLGVGATGNGTGAINYLNGNWAALPVTFQGSITIGKTYTILSVGTSDFTTVGASLNASGQTFVATGSTYTGTGTCYLTPPITLVAATALVNGTPYCIASVGTTDYTSVGSPNNNIGQYFVATGAATGNGTAYLCQAQTFAANVFTVHTDSFTLSYQPNNNYITSWNLYRAGDTGSSYSLVANIPVCQTGYIDQIGITGLGGTLATSYTDPEGTLITYAPPPSSASNPTLYKSMVFMINGNNVIWTPVGFPDAFPPQYSIPFPFPPLWLEAYNDALCVFCADKIYRLDGYDAGSITKTDTKAEGCIAPYSVQVTQNVCLYLSKRGIMMFDGHQAQCISEPVIPYKMFTMPSGNSGITSQGFWWRTTDNEAQMGELLWASGNAATSLDPAAAITARDVVQDGPIYAIKSFIWQNKYYLYYSDTTTTDYSAATSWCLDMGTPGMPVTTLGMKALDTHVNETGECFILVPHYNAPASGPTTNTSAFLSAQSNYDSSPVYGTSAGTFDIMRFNPIQAIKVPLRIRSSESAANSPNLRKRWRVVWFYGDGTAQVRLYLDGKLVTFANGSNQVTIDSSDQPNLPRRILLPPGSWGYALAHEIIGPIDLRAVEYGFDWMTGKKYD